MSKLEDFLVKIGKRELIPQSTNIPDCLDLGGVDLGGEFQNLVEVLKEQNSITKLVLGNVGKITNLDLNVLAKFLESKECKIKDFNFSSNGLNATTISLLSDSLEKNKTIETLSLNDNPLGDKGFSILLQALSKNDTVRSLGLYCIDVELKEEVEPAVIEFCKQNKAVKSFLISNTPNGVAIEPENATKFMQAIYQKSNLTTLGINAIKLDDEGTLELIKLLEKPNTQINEVYCNIRPTKPETREKLLEAIEKNKTLTSFVTLQKGATTEVKELSKPIQIVIDRNIKEIQTIAQKLTDFYNISEESEALYKKYTAIFKEYQLHEKENIKYHGKLNDKVLDKVDKYINEYFCVIKEFAKVLQAKGMPDEIVCNILKYVNFNDSSFQQPQPSEDTVCLGNVSEE